MTQKFAHRLQWGAEVLDGGFARFRLWAPRTETLALVCDGGDIPLERGEDGWFELVTDRVAVGGAYAYRLPDGMVVPDPAARAQAGDVHGPSKLVDPRAYEWRTGTWRGRPWEEAAIYELHTGTFSESGTFNGIERHLDHLAETGITAVELMPVAQFSGNRGWGYDGVLLYAPHTAYGGPDQLKNLIDSAHERDLMVLLDVVYNHFGPDGNYLHLYAPEFFDPERATPWGGAIAYDRTTVRDFFVENALFWLEEYRFDGLRLDAVNEIHDPSSEHLLETIAQEARARIADRHIHLTTEDDRNITRLHERDDDNSPVLFTAEWNDDFHHAAHVIATAETEGYYIDYTPDPVAKLARALSEGYIFQGEESRFGGGMPRGVPSSHLPPTAFVNFLQNHDQIGNRAFSERLDDLTTDHAVEALLAVLILGPHIPLIFMGDEWGEVRPFGFFTDFHGELADAVREGRRREFRRFARFADEANREKIPDPNAESTFTASRLDWDRLATSDGERRWRLVRDLLNIRRREIVPHLGTMRCYDGTTSSIDGTAIGIRWKLDTRTALVLFANLGNEPAACPMQPKGRMLYGAPDGWSRGDAPVQMPPWSVAVLLDEATG